jgi:hypothetical protein
MFDLLRRLALTLFYSGGVKHFVRKKKARGEAGGPKNTSGAAKMYLPPHELRQKMNHRADVPKIFQYWPGCVSSVD